MPEKRAFTMAQAQNYMDTMRQTRWLLGIGVALIVFAAAPFVGTGGRLRQRRGHA
jgi:hypothetical protein